MDALDELFEAARAARGRAYAPYSRFPVGAAIRAGSGAIYVGCNVENAASPVGVCAEASAISAMVVAGESRIVDIAIVGRGDDTVTPCGACRQRIHEFAEAGTRIHAAGAGGGRKNYTIADLLPDAFGPGNLRAAGANTSEKL